VIELPTEPLKVMEGCARAPVLRNSHCVIGTATVDHDTLVAERHAVETGTDIPRLILRNNDGA
jgi:hypothetical protein